MSKQLTLAEIKEHSQKKDLYMIVHDKVYDVTKFVDEHPYVSQSNPNLSAMRLALFAIKSTDLD